MRIQGKGLFEVAASLLTAELCLMGRLVLFDQYVEAQLALPLWETTSGNQGGLVKAPLTNACCVERDWNEIIGWRKFSQTR